MSWDLATAKKYLGLEADDTRDDDITATMAWVVSAIEGFLARDLLRMRETVKFLQTRYLSSIQVKRYPLWNIYGVNGSGTIPDLWEQHGEGGWIDFNGSSGLPSIELDYEGGYATDALPPELERVMWEVFMEAWRVVDPDTGGPPADSVANTGTGEVKSLTVFDAYKVDYDVGTVSEGSSAISEGAWGWLAPWGSTLQRYRNGPAGAGGLGVV